MRIITTGLLLVTCCGLTACANQVDDFGLEEHIGSVSQAAGPTPDGNGLDVYIVTTAPIFQDYTLAHALLDNPLTTSTLSPLIISEICSYPVNAGSSKAFEYIVKCAATSTTSVVVNCGSNDIRTYNGLVGMNGNWPTSTGACSKSTAPNSSTQCEQLNSACILAHSNFAGENISLQLTGPLGAGLNSSPKNPSFSKVEAAFWGNVYNFDNADAATRRSRRMGCTGENANDLYYSAKMQKNVEYMARSCGYYNLNSYHRCMWCTSGTEWESGNACLGLDSSAIDWYLGNVVVSTSAVKSCSSLCTTNTVTTSGDGYYQNCGTSGSLAYGHQVTVWRNPNEFPAQ